MLKVKKSFSVFIASIIVFLGFNIASTVKAYTDEDIELDKVKMLFIDMSDSSSSKTPTLSGTENCSFSDENTICDVVGRTGSRYYIIFGESTDPRRFVGNKNNTYQGSENLKRDYSIKIVRNSKSKTVDGMGVSAKYIEKFNNIKNGVWGVVINFPEGNVDISSAVDYSFTATLKKDGAEKDFTINMKLMPPEKINDAAVDMSSNNTIVIQYTNSTEITATGFARMRKSKKRSFIIEFPNGVKVYIPRVMKQKTNCFVGGSFELCPDMDDHIMDKVKNFFFVNVAGTMKDSIKMSYPLDEAFAEDQDKLKEWTNDKRVYIYPVNLEELSQKDDIKDNTNLIDFSRAKETTIKDGRVEFSVVNGSIDVSKEIYMICLKPLSEEDFPTSSKVKIKLKTKTAKTKKSTAKSKSKN